jgi:hypothetical protein
MDRMALILPGWNSVEAAAKWHRGFEIAGFVALGLLLLFEVLSYVYGNRKDVLLLAQQSSIAGEERKQQEARDKNSSDNVAAANAAAQKATDAQKRAEEKAAELEARLTPRKLSEEQKANLMRLLSKHTGYEITLLSVLGNKESQDYRDEFSELFQKAGWKVNPPPFRMPIRDVQGLKILVADLSKAPQAAIILQQALKEVGINADGGVDSGLKPETFELYVGFK